MNRGGIEVGTAGRCLGSAAREVGPAGQTLGNPRMSILHTSARRILPYGVPIAIFCSLGRVDSNQRGPSMPITQVELARRLRAARKACHITQAKAARVLGIPRSAVSQIETGQRAVSALELHRLAQLYSAMSEVSWRTGSRRAIRSRRCSGRTPS